MVRQIIAYTLALVALSIVLGPVAHLGPAYVAVAAVLGAVFLQRALSLRANPTPKAAMRLFGWSISYLTALFVAMGVIAVVQHP